MRLTPSPPPSHKHSQNPSRWPHLPSWSMHLEFLPRFLWKHGNYIPPTFISFCSFLLLPWANLDMFYEAHTALQNRFEDLYPKSSLAYPISVNSLTGIPHSCSSQKSAGFFDAVLSSHYSQMQTSGRTTKSCTLAQLASSHSTALPSPSTMAFWGASFTTHKIFLYGFPFIPE